nr:acetone carboxylase [Microlunatus antarcticus]
MFPADPPPTDLPDELICSARGCTAPATTDVRWNNVKIHTPERRKHWLACDEHTDSLASYLGARGMLREVVPLGAEAPGSD